MIWLNGKAARLIPVLFTLFVTGAVITEPLGQFHPTSPNGLAPRLAYNCDGSAMCTFVPNTVTSSTGQEIYTIEALRLGIHASKMSDGTQCCNGENIICFAKSWELGLGVGLGKIGGPEASTSPRAVTICVFLEDFNGTRPLTLQETRALMDELFGRGCKQCSRIETNWLDDGKNKYSGYLKMDYKAKDDVCAGRCIGPSSNLTLGVQDANQGRTCKASKNHAASGLPGMRMGLGLGLLVTVMCLLL
ncbi:hypothetical protein B0H63DRAFT_522468 [Podospora didyma]|uniref:Killer toxin Kp4 domain-containing protein n=1 Tax=Podospora didyma TaxID=330526 RepID=A0AAE0NP57_9PEZI|nr:hypothetical protein B0H63DRAFT_522468 [Podospora didyma]